MATPFPFVAGNVLTAAQLNAIGESMISFTPTITSGGTFTIGNGSLTGRYTQVNKLVIATYQLIWGSTTSDAGTNEWVWSLPVPADANAIIGGSARILDAGTTFYRAIAVGGSSGLLFQGNDSGNAILKTVPMTWATNDTLNGLIVYEAD